MPLNEDAHRPSRVAGWQRDIRPFQDPRMLLSLGRILARRSFRTTLHGSRAMPHFHSAAPACAALFAIAGLAGAALAQPSPDVGDLDTVWNCWYNNDTTFRCRLARAPDDPGERDAEPQRPEARPQSLYPRRGRPLPAIVRTIHEHPARLRGHTITIPLFSPPLDTPFAGELVQAVMCGRRPMCRARIFRSAAAVAQQYEENPARAR